jgi:hypothetical protein
MKNYEIVKLDSNCAELKIPYLRFHCFSLRKFCVWRNFLLLGFSVFHLKQWRFCSGDSRLELVGRSGKASVLLGNNVKVDEVEFRYFVWEKLDFYIREALECFKG